MEVIKMFKLNNLRPPHEWHNTHLSGEHPAPPPHIRASQIRLSCDDETIAKLESLYGDINYVLQILEICPPEIKLTLAMLFGIKVDLSDYPYETISMVRFANPFLDERNSKLIGKALNCSEEDIAVSIYNACPPEQALLALAVAVLKNTVKEA